MENETIFCRNCGVEINWSPVVIAGQAFCCQDCANGLACECGDRMEQEDDRPTKPDFTVMLSTFLLS